MEQQIGDIGDLGRKDIMYARHQPFYTRNPFCSRDHGFAAGHILHNFQAGTTREAMAFCVRQQNHICLPDSFW